MLEENDNPQVAAEADANALGVAARTRFENRRRLLKAIAVATPLMITLRGKPAHAQLSSLGSAGILYGPGAYVTPADVGQGGIEEADLWKPLKVDPNDPTGKTFQVLTDTTRRKQDSVEPDKTVTRP